MISDSLLTRFDSYIGNMSRLGDDWPVLDGGSAAGDRWIVGEMYYLMGDYCFKTGDFARAIEHYRRHLIVAGRSDHSFNSWGGCALAGAAVLSSYLQVNSCKFSSIVRIFRTVNWKSIEHR
jgi:hypothetical protein